MAKRSLCMLLAVVALFSLAVPAFAEEEPVAPEEAAPEAEPMTAASSNVIDSGVCGAQGGNVTWTLTGAPWDGQGTPDTTDWVLTISGTGDMADYGERESPWANYSRTSWSFPSVVIEKGVTSIGANAFFEAGMLTSVSLPSTLKVIGKEAFAHAFNLVHITIPDGVTEIRNSAFYWCVSLTDVNIPSGVKTIEDWAFCQCGMSSVTIPEGVVSIGEGAFQQCANLASATVAASVKTIGDMAFSTTALKDITVLNPDCVIGKETYKGEEYYSIDLTLGDHYPDKTVIHGYDGSTAEAYAKWWGHTFKSLGKAPGTATLAAPKLSGASNTATGVKISWKAVSGAAKYQVYYKTTGGWKKAGGTTTKTSYTWTGAKSGTKYTFTVKAYDKAGNAGKYDKTGKSVTYYAAPEVSIAKTSSGIKVSWNKISGAPRYMVYYKENGGGWKKIGTTTSTSYTRKASKLKSGATYQFTVRCVKNDKTTLLSAYTASNSLKYTAELAAPTVKIALTSSGGIKVSWNKVSGAPRYTVYYKENGGGWHKIGTTTSTNYTRKASKLKSGVTYQFTVRCCDSDKTTLLSGYKASNSLKYTAELAAPTVKIALTSNGGIKVSWNAISGAPRYAVYYKENGGGWHKIGTTTNTSYTRKAAKLKSGVTYQFTVRCVKNDKTTMLSGYTASNSLKYTK